MNTKIVSPLIKYLLAWLPLPAIAVFNGILRELTYCHIAGEQLAQQISSILLSLMIVLYVVLLNSRLRLDSSRDAVVVGIVWFALTIAFETGLGFLEGTPLREQLEAYNVIKGNFWPLVLVAVLCSPILLRKITFANGVNGAQKGV